MAVDTGKLKIGDRLSETQYYEVVKLGVSRITVRNERGYQFDIDFEVVREGLESADQYTEEQTVTLTKLGEIFESVGNTIFMVNFTKKPTVKNVLPKLKEILEKKSEFSSDKQLKETAEDLITGESRTLTGYLLSVDRQTGRSMVVDLEIPHDKNRIRQVDNRTLKWLIFKGVKYILK